MWHIAAVLYNSILSRTTQTAGQLWPMILKYRNSRVQCLY